MKGFYAITAGILFLCLVLFPVFAIKGQNSAESDKKTDSNISAAKTETAFRVKLSDTGEIKNIDETEYVIGVVSAEVPATYEPEALKAQAVASYTYARYKQLQKNHDYDVTDSEQTDQKYYTKNERKKRWGKNFNDYEKRIESAVNAVKGQLIKYKNKPILAVYHSVSSGKTESAENIWDKNYPYLKSVESVGDLLSSDCVSKAEFTADEFAKTAKGLGADCKNDPNGWVSDIKKTPAGTVKSVKIGNKQVSGVDVRSAFSLRSPCFDLEYSDKKFVFTVRGYGHLLGMSQNGADYMAKQGSNYKEILLWYYSGCKIGK